MQVYTKTYEWDTIVQKQRVRRGTAWILLQHPGQNPIVKNARHKFWTDKTRLQLLYSDDVYAFFKRAFRGFVYLTDLD
jgi:hypothetical protein